MPDVDGQPASLPERMVATTLTKLGIDYTFQQRYLGGRTVKGGVVADFTLFGLGIIISVLGEYYHYGMDRTGQDLMQRTALLSQQNLLTIFLDESDIMDDADFYVREAIRGIDHSKAARM